MGTRTRAEMADLESSIGKFNSQNEIRIIPRFFRVFFIFRSLHPKSISLSLFYQEFSPGSSLYLSLCLCFPIPKMVEWSSHTFGWKCMCKCWAFWQLLILHFTLDYPIVSRVRYPCCPCDALQFNDNLWNKYFQGHHIVIGVPWRTPRSFKWNLTLRREQAIISCPTVLLSGLWGLLLDWHCADVT